MIEMNLDELQRKVAVEIQEEFKKINIKATVSYCGLGQSDIKNRSFSIYVYRDKYSYVTVGYIFNPEVKADIYCARALQDIEEKKCIEHKIGTEEIYISELIELNLCKELYILEGELRSIKSTDTVDLTSIEVLTYDKPKSLITILEESGEKIVVNLVDETIKCVDEEGEN